MAYKVVSCGHLSLIYAHQRRNMPFYMPLLIPPQMEYRPFGFSCVVSSSYKSRAARCCFVTLGISTFSSDFFLELDSLKKADKWQRIIELGESALEKESHQEKRFKIHEQLVSTYFRLGLFKKAEQHALCLLKIIPFLERPELAVEALYKYSASLRGVAAESLSSQERNYHFQHAQVICQRALQICEESLPDDPSLKAKALFNASAAECDHQNGNHALGLKYIELAYCLFNKYPVGDYPERTQMRLAKAYLLNNKVELARYFVSLLKMRSFEKRTEMHLFLLEAQVLMAEHKPLLAWDVICKGKEKALQLGAQADANRFDALLLQLIQK